MMWWLLGLIEILYIYEDGIQDVLYLDKVPEDYIEEMGKSVFEVIKNLRNPLIKRKSARFFNHGNCVNIVDEIGSDQQRLYLGALNSLRPIRELDDREFNFVEELVEKEKNRRIKKA